MIMKPALTLDDAKKLLAAAEEEATRQGWEVVISVLNDGGRIIALHRMDGARPGNDDISLGKANTAAMTARPSGVWERWIQNDHKAYATFGLLAASSAQWASPASKPSRTNKSPYMQSTPYSRKPQQRVLTKKAIRT